MRNRSEITTDIQALIARMETGADDYAAAEPAEDAEARDAAGAAFDASWTADTAELAALERELERVATLEAAAARHGGTVDADANTGVGLQIVKSRDAHPLDIAERTHIGATREQRDEAFSAAMTIIEDTVQGDGAEARQANAENLFRGRGVELASGYDDGRSATHKVALHVLRTGSEDYRQAFSKLVTGRGAMLSPAEQRAAMAVGADATGGYMVPTHLDPTVLVTNTGSRNPVSRIARNVTLVDGNVWNGVTSAGVTAAFGAEAAEVADGSPTVGTVAITAHKYDVYAQASMEAMQDIDGLDSTLLTLMADGVDNLLADKLVTGAGDGSNEPVGVITWTTNASAVTDTAAVATLAPGDLYTLRYTTLGERWRDNSTWLQSDAITSAIRQFGSTDGNFTVDMLADGVRTLMGRPIAATDAVGTTLATDDEVTILGDFSTFVIVNKLGFRVQNIPFVLATGANRPTGESGWYGAGRIGASGTVNGALQRLDVL